MATSLLAWPAGATTYRLDPDATTASFEVWFLKIFPIRGEFRRTTGTLVYDGPAQPAEVQVSIDATTLESHVGNSHQSARGPDFFHVAKFPSIDFRSTRFVFDNDRLAAIEGELSLVGHVKPVVLKVERAGCEPRSAEAPATCRAEGEVTVKRSDYGMRAWRRSLSEEVTIRVRLVAREVSPAS